MKKLLFTLATLTALASTDAYADKYKCVSNGYPSYQEKPCDDQTSAKVVEIDIKKGKVQERKPGKEKKPAVKKGLYVGGKSQVVYPEQDKSSAP